MMTSAQRFTYRDVSGVECPGKTTPLFDGVLGATRFSAIERNSPAGGCAPPMPRTLEMGGAV